MGPKAQINKILQNTRFSGDSFIKLLRREGPENFSHDTQYIEMETKDKG